MKKCMGALKKIIKQRCWQCWLLFRRDRVVNNCSSLAVLHHPFFFDPPLSEKKNSPVKDKWLVHSLRQDLIVERIVLVKLCELAVLSVNELRSVLTSCKKHFFPPKMMYSLDNKCQREQKHQIRWNWKEPVLFLAFEKQCHGWHHSIYVWYISFFIVKIQTKYC